MKVLSLVTAMTIALGMINSVINPSPVMSCTPTRRDSGDSKGKPRPSPSPSPSFSLIQN